MQFYSQCVCCSFMVVGTILVCRYESMCNFVVSVVSMAVENRVASRLLPLATDHHNDN
jgi:hypothetical protein